MSEEEKEAIDILNNVIADEVVGTYCLEIQKTTNCAENCKDDNCFIIKAIDTVTNLINKQQKEIEVLRQENFDTVYMKAVADFKDKIRKKIKRCKKELEENNENIDYTRKLVYTADETIKKEIQDLEELLEE